MALRLMCLAALAAASASAQTPDSVAARPPARNIFGGVEGRRPLTAQAIFAGNVGAMAALTAGRGLVEGVPARRLPGVMLGGAAAGAGFYGAKRLVGERHPVAGFALAYASASLAENVAEGGHALSHVRIGLGPLDVRVATPFAAERASGRRAGAGVGIEIEPLSVAAGVVLPLRGFRPSACGAGLCYRRGAPERVVRNGRTFRRLGRTVGRVVRLWTPFLPRSEAHEGVHVVQAMQLAAVTPGGTLRALTGQTTDAGVALDVRTDWFSPLAAAAVFSLAPYERVWTEREAFTLAGPDAAPLPTPASAPR